MPAHNDKPYRLGTWLRMADPLDALILRILLGLFHPTLLPSYVLVLELHRPFPGSLGTSK